MGIMKLDIVKLAEKIAREAHKGQKRKFSGDPYIVHPQRVAKSLDTDVERAIGWTHDVEEDSDFSIIDLLRRGLPQVVVGTVSILSRGVNADYADYILRIRGNKLATKVKIADLKDNLQDLKKGSLRDKYELSLIILTESI